jgi:Tfp pilus assembly protein PilN
MPAWLMPVLKTVLPYVGTIVSAAAPVFTKKSGDVAANQTVLLQQQITELQAAASANDAHIKELAIQLQHTVEALEKGASLADRRHQWMLVFSILAMLISVTSLGTVLYLLLAR